MAQGFPGLTGERAAGADDRAESRAVARVRGLTRRFGERTVLDGADLTIERGEFVALLGRSGSGKSTLLRALAGLDRETGGDLAVDGTVAVAFQEPRLVPWKKVRANVALGLRTSGGGASGTSGGGPRAAADKALAEVGLAERGDAWPLTLSGGEAQRASLARALVREPGLLLLDEPFSALDALTRITMHRLVLDLWERHRPGVLLVTHDVDEALLLADRVLVLDGGRIAHETRVRLPRPRPRDHPDLSGLRATLLARLGVTPEDAPQDAPQDVPGGPRADVPGETP
ncbi:MULTISPECIES: ABC transporter ATP-binding protein [Actinomadura]|uniref:ABC transporter ATP-binding protein n=1 Tax=Actinomadura yumaensis TaxID=111807 RepID=A0ABW2CMV0_9ACTN|nr:ABC transporter ATP-binding protein [Actinomadura sp. J1-007]MWK39017.1 ATP-binding cassette domain-containing protein [Actinomadura sp. J1-007]